MNKFLMGVSALALASTVGVGKAEAVEWDLDWGGYYNSAIIYRDSDTLNSDQEGIDVVQDGEIHFTPSIVTDNGLEFGVVVEIEADPTAGQTIDDSHVYVEGPFGQLVLGSESGAASKMHYGAPNVGWFGAADGGDVDGYLLLGGLNFGRSPAWAGAANRISYYTPRFSGFQVGASYAHDDNQNKSSPNAISVGKNYDVGANYIGNFGLFSIKVGGVYSRAEGIAADAINGEYVNGGDVNGTPISFAPGTVIPLTAIVTKPATPAINNPGDSDMYGGGMQLGYGGFTVGANYTTQDVAGENDERDYYDVGVQYKTGPWGVSFQWAHSEQGALEGDNYLGAATYNIGPGVTAGVYAGYGEADVGGGNNVDGFLVGTGFALSF